MAYRKPAQPAPIPAGLPDTIDPVAEYRVQLLEPVKVGAVTLPASDVHVMTGETLKSIKASVYGAVPTP